jgi:hypothetical protein
MYDTTKAEALKENGRLLGYLLRVNDEYWLPLTVEGAPAGPPTYRADAESTLRRAAE